MGGFLAYEGDAVVEFDLTPAIHSLAQIRDVDRLAAASGKPIRYHLKIDSGMGRLGRVLKRFRDFAVQRRQPLPYSYSVRRNLYKGYPQPSKPAACGKGVRSIANRRRLVAR
jgi:hypothetical protein